MTKIKFILSKFFIFAISRTPEELHLTDGTCAARRKSHLFFSSFSGSARQGRSRSRSWSRSWQRRAMRNRELELKWRSKSSSNVTLWPHWPRQPRPKAPGLRFRTTTITTATLRRTWWGTTQQPIWISRVKEVTFPRQGPTPHLEVTMVGQPQSARPRTRPHPLWSAPEVRLARVRCHTLSRPHLHRVLHLPSTARLCHRQARCRRLRPWTDSRTCNPSTTGRLAKERPRTLEITAVLRGPFPQAWGCRRARWPRLQRPLPASVCRWCPTLGCLTPSRLITTRCPASTR